MAGLNPWEAQEAHRGRIGQIKENSARLAFSYARFDTNGWGEFQVPNVVEFDCTFVEMPFVSYGFTIDGDTLVASRFPRSNGFVFKWRQDVHGFYTGCWIAFTVDTQSPFIATRAIEPGYDLDHHFVFQGLAYKDLPAYLLDQDQS